jgi:hypothetical protein
MLRSTAQFRAFSHCPLPVLAFLAIAPLAAPDAVVVNGQRYENIYLGAGTDSYYIQNPEDGSMITVPKSAVKEKDIEITPDRNERRRLHDQWRLRQMNKSVDPPISAPAALSPKSATPATTEPPAPRPEAGVKPIKLPVAISGLGPRDKDRQNDTVAIGNVEPHGSLNGRKVFIDARGTPVLTNKPEKFSGRPEYVEVTLHYQIIQVPERFRQAAASPTVSAAKHKVNGQNSVGEIVDYYTRQYSLDKSLVYAVIKAESNGDRFAVSSAGARGLMQLMPGTAREMGVKDIFDPAENIAGGTQYLATLLNLFNDNVTLALAGYNAGPGNVKKYGGVPPFEETQNYVQKVKLFQRQFKRSGTPRIELASAKPVDKTYLPPESKQYYQIILDNGLSVAAEQVYKDEGRYIYVFKGRSGHFAENAVVQVIEPS